MKAAVNSRVDVACQRDGQLGNGLRLAEENNIQASNNFPKCFTSATNTFLNFLLSFPRILRTQTPSEGGRLPVRGVGSAAGAPAGCRCRCVIVAALNKSPLTKKPFHFISIFCFFFTESLESGSETDIVTKCECAAQGRYRGKSSRTHTHTHKGLLSACECSSVSDLTDAAFRM